MRAYYPNKYNIFNMVQRITLIRLQTLYTLPTYSNFPLSYILLWKIYYTLKYLRASSPCSYSSVTSACRIRIIPFHNSQFVEGSVNGDLSECSIFAVLINPTPPPLSLSLYASAGAVAMSTFRQR